MFQTELDATLGAARGTSALKTAQQSLALPIVLLVIGFMVRLAQAAYRFLNPDEALHYLLGVQPSLLAAYNASLTTAHPPLLIVFLHYWGMMGHSELFLRLPSLLAGTAFCWIIFCWLRRVTNDSTALVGLILLLFSPALVLLSAEVRQYSLLLLFCAASLYWLDRAIQENSISGLLISSGALYLALLTHYSALIFALTLGIYGLLRLVVTRARAKMVAAWAAGQVGALCLIAFMFRQHISKLEASGEMNSMAATYLRRSIFNPSQDHVLSFIVRSNLRLFHYFFSQGAVGAVGLTLFVCGLVVLLRSPSHPNAARLPSNRQMAFLLTLPLLVNCAVALLRRYPYGGTRHNSYLAIFVMPGIAIALDRWNPKWKMWEPVALGLVLAACNFFPTPQGEYIPARDQNRALMTEAVASLKALPPGSTIFTDNQGGLLLSYYLCGNKVVQIEENPFRPFMRSRCGEHSVISIDPSWWIFKAETFPETLRGAQHTFNLTPGEILWLFQSGWFIDKEFALREELKQVGCSAPHDFGHNMFLCPVKLNTE